MAITRVELGGVPAMVGVNGVYRDQIQAELLGLKSLSLKLENFWIGFDTRIRPAIVRIYFDPLAWGITPDDGYTEIALVQIGRITYQNVPLSPAIFGMGLEHLIPYTYSNPDDPMNSEYWVDIMDVAKMREKARARGGSFYPYFPYNGFLRNKDYPFPQFFTHPMPNGSLTNVPAPQAPGSSFCASMFDAIDFDLDVPPANEITKMLIRMGTNQIAPVKIKTFSHSDISQYGPLPLALNLLEIEDSTQIEEVQVAGPHMIIQMKDIEAEGPIFIAFFDSNQETNSTSTMMIFLVDSDQFEQIRFSNLTGLFGRIGQHFAESGMLGEAGFPTPQPPVLKRGNKGLNPFPFRFNENENPEIAFTYNTIALGIKGDEIDFCFGCIKWQVSRVFEMDTLEFGPLRIEKPTLNQAASMGLNNLLQDLAEDDPHFVFKVINQYTDALQGTATNNITNPYLYEDNKQVLNPDNPAFGDGTQTWSEA